MRCLAAICFLLAAGAARADDTTLWNELGLGGSIRSGYWSSDRSLDSLTNFAPTSVWLKAQPKLHGGFYAGAEGWALDESLFHDGNRVRADLREAYVGWRDGSVDISIGRTLVSWGRADQINPTDIISPHDYTRMFVQDDLLREGVTLARASYAFGDMTASAFWVPEFRPNIYPVARAPGLEAQQGTDRFQGDQFAVRLDRTGTGFDWSLSYFNGVNRNPGSRLDGPPGSTTLVSAIYNRTQMIGGDFATNVGSFGLRGEIAYERSAQPAGSLFNPQPFVEGVIGVDKNVLENTNVTAQYVLRYNFLGHAAALPPALQPIADDTALLNNQLTRFQHGPSVRLSHTALNDTLLLEITAAVFVSDGSFVIRPRATYAITDNVKMEVGAEFFGGRSLSYFGYLHDNSTFLSEISWSF